MMNHYVHTTLYIVDHTCKYHLDLIIILTKVMFFIKGRQISSSKEAGIQIAVYTTGKNCKICLAHS